MSYSNNIRIYQFIVVVEFEITMNEKGEQMLIVDAAKFRFVNYIKISSEKLILNAL